MLELLAQFTRKPLQRTSPLLIHREAPQSLFEGAEKLADFRVLALQVVDHLISMSGPSLQGKGVGSILVSIVVLCIQRRSVYLPPSWRNPIRLSLGTGSGTASVGDLPAAPGGVRLSVDTDLASTGLQRFLDEWRALRSCPASTLAEIWWRTATEGAPPAQMPSARHTSSCGGPMRSLDLW